MMQAKTLALVLDAVLFGERVRRVHAGTTLIVVGIACLLYGK